ncbi:glycosyltransferase family 2 protein [uncultured Shimia sp.]|uniref:glycosyltransferase family 2 protein n=1 Tax=uncultured Shimia sp. TaxID=573152 RepID=UPI003454601A
MLSILIPANNEAAHIGPCLEAVLASEGPDVAQIVVAANGCDDDTVQIAERYRTTVEAKGWTLTVLNLPALGKMGALNAADEAASFGNRAYLDADVLVDPALMGQITKTLNTDTPRYASGKLRLSRAKTWATRAYARTYSKVPFITHGVPGAGLFAVNAAGRARWQDFPGIISDDTFVRLNFAPEERISTEAGYDWPLVEGFAALVKVRRRQNAGVDEIVARFPELLKNDDKVTLSFGEKLGMMLRDPLGFAVYAAVSVVVKLSPQKSDSWERGR